MISSRRGFLESTAVLFAANPLRATFRYVTTSHAIQVFSRQGGEWTAVQTVASHSPTALTRHPSGHILYVANDIDVYERLPRGSVEAYSVSPRNGMLTLLCRQPLSLSATRPRSLALAPDGQHLVAAAYGGGSYNVFAVQPSGAVAEIKSIFKEIGSGAHPEHQTSAHPHSLIFNPRGHFLLATDFGCDRISVFRLVGGALERVSQCQTAPGAGPGSLAFNASGTRLYVRHKLHASVCCYRFEPGTGQLAEERT